VKNRGGGEEEVEEHEGKEEVLTVKRNRNESERKETEKGKLFETEETSYRGRHRRSRAEGKEKKEKEDGIRGATEGTERGRTRVHARRWRDIVRGGI